MQVLNTVGSTMKSEQLPRLTRFTYSLRQAPSGGTYAQFDIRSQNQSAKVGLTPDETTELWITYAEMPHALERLVDDRTWEAHRKPILAMLSAHYLRLLN